MQFLLSSAISRVLARVLSEGNASGGGMISKIRVLYRAGIFGKLLAGGINGRLQEISG